MKKFCIFGLFLLVLLSSCTNNEENSVNSNDIPNVDNVIPDMEGVIPDDSEIIVNQDDVIEEVK